MDKDFIEMIRIAYVNDVGFEMSASCLSKENCI